MDHFSLETQVHRCGYRVGVSDKASQHSASVTTNRGTVEPRPSPSQVCLCEQAESEQSGRSVHSDQIQIVLERRAAGGSTAR